MWTTSSVRRILAYREPVDLRRSFPGLVGLGKGVLAEDPLSGSVFVFINRRGTLMKMLYWDRTGLCLFANYLSSYYTSFSARRGFCCLAVCRAAARSARWSQRLQCFSGTFGSGTS
jgi:transposase